MAAMPTGTIATVTGPGNRRGIIATIAIPTIGRCFHIGRSGRNGSLKGDGACIAALGCDPIEKDQ
jgi:hypothetical protein